MRLLGRATLFYKLFIAFSMRTQENKSERMLVGDTVNAIGEEVKLQGWIHTVRDHGKLTFIDIRDRSGIVQCVGFEIKEKFTEESVVEITGVVKNRSVKNTNKNTATGAIEIEIKKIILLNSAKELPFTPKSDGKNLSEELRLKYRYLDLRRERMTKILTIRSNFVQGLREVLFRYGFREIETPILGKGTKEGARNFIVPSRLNPGKFYALPQSPQQYKQLLMAAGVERYFQIAKCIRDEDLRADRGFEFTQLDLEISFTTEKEVWQLTEEALVNAVKASGGKVREERFPVFTYAEAMEKYGSDKFDIRTEEEKEKNTLAFAWVHRYPMFKKVDTKDAGEIADSRSGWVFTHNPFSNPIEEHIPWHLSHEHIGEIIASQYDLVCNGYEVASGSIRAHQPEVLKATYEIMGYSEKDIQENIGHMLEAFSLGTPPHGGVAPGIDRLVMIIAGETSLKETIAFPMTSTGKTSVMDAPSFVDDTQLKIFGIKNIAEETNVIFEQIKLLLNEAAVSYHILEHKPVKTSEEAAEVRGTSMSMAPKAMILAKKDGTLLMACVPADQQLNLEAVSEAVGETVRIASPDQVEKKLGVKVGAVPPFGNVFCIEMYLDGDFWKKDEVVFNAGRRDRSIRMKAADLIAVAKPNKISKDLDLKKTAQWSIATHLSRKRTY